MCSSDLDIPFAGTIRNGETVKIECVSWPRCDDCGEAPHLQYQLTLGRLDGWSDRWVEELGPSFARKLTMD